jgi:hypothetical protein
LIVAQRATWHGRSSPTPGFSAAWAKPSPMPLSWRFAAQRQAIALLCLRMSPPSDSMRLLLPLCLVSDNKADCAISLELMASGAYRATSVTSLPRAYASARVISAEQPSWLSPRCRAWVTHGSKHAVNKPLVRRTTRFRPGAFSASRSSFGA